MTVEELLDKVQERLHDDGVLWSREELLEWANDGYGDILSASRAVVRPYQYDMPPRCSAAGTYEFEDLGGTFQKFTHRHKLIHSTYEWEVEQLEGVSSPTNSYHAVSHLWETAHLTTDTNRHFRFIVSKSHQQPLRVYWDDKQLTGTSDRDLDMRDTRWWIEDGEPIAWLKGNGRDQSFEIFEATTDYTQAYDLRDCQAGMPRYFTGSRTYGVDSGVDRWDYAFTGGGDFHVAGLGFRITGQATDTDTSFFLFDWEEEQLEGSTVSSTGVTVYTAFWEVTLDSTAVEVFPGVGLPRYITSSDRQYLAAPYEGGGFSPCGLPRDFKSSVTSVTLWEVIIPNRSLTETDEPTLLPEQLHKYLKFYVLSQAFGRKGEGQKLELAAHYAALYQTGVKFLTAMGDLAFIDRVYQREETQPVGRGRPPRVRLPSTYPQPRF